MRFHAYHIIKAMLHGSQAAHLVCHLVEDLKHLLWHIGHPHRQDGHRLAEVRIADLQALLVGCMLRRSTMSHCGRAQQLCSTTDKQITISTA